jgi:hypothetical protein
MTTQTPTALELRWYWGDLLLDTQHHLKGDGPVATAARPTSTWSVLGVPLATVSGNWRHLLRFAPPLLSEVETSDVDCSLMSPTSNTPHTLFEWDGDDVTARMLPGWAATRSHGGDDSALGARSVDGERLYTLRDGDVLTLSHTAIRVEARLTDAPRGLVSRPTDDVDYGFVGTMSIAGFAAAIIALLLWTAPAPTHLHATAAMDQLNERMVQLTLPQEPEFAVETEEEAAAESAEAAAEDEGQTCEDDALLEAAEIGNSQSDDEAAVDNAGVFGAWSAAGMDSLGEGLLSGGLADSIGSLTGPKAAQRGTGLGRSRHGPGGGGHTEGLGGWGPRGNGPGGNPFGDGGCADCTTKREGGITTVQEPIVLGLSVDRSLIQEVVLRHMQEIRYCYQRELQRSANLGGKVVVGFTIAMDGTVSRAATKESSVNNSAVESCVNGRFMRMQFPELGGMAIVSYPFLFSPG